MGGPQGGGCRGGTHATRLASHALRSLQPESLYAEFALSPHELAVLSEAVKGVRGETLTLPALSGRILIIGVTFLNF